MTRDGEILCEKCGALLLIMESDGGTYSPKLPSLLFFGEALVTCKECGKGQKVTTKRFRQRKTA